MASNYFLEGPINSGDSFVVTTISAGILYVLDTFNPPSSSAVDYYWNVNYAQNGELSSTIPVFTASGTPGSFTITDTINGGGFAASTGNIIVNGGLPSSLGSTSTYANWNTPVLFLAGAGYTLSYNGNVVNFLTSTVGTSNIPAVNIVFLPVVWYNTCTGGSTGTYNQSNTPAGSITSWTCVNAPTADICSGADYATGGWTNLTDCQNGLDYQYCTGGQTCGDSSCRGPCSRVYDECVLVPGSTSNDYHCVINYNNYLEDTQWWKSPWFIGIIIGLVLVAAVITAVGVFLINRKKSK